MDEAVQEVPKEHFPSEIKLEKGMQLAAQGPHGVIPVVIADIKKDSVLVDFNHPLAGKDLIFEVEIVEVRTVTPEELAHGHTHGAHGHHGHEDEDECCGSSSGHKEDKNCCGSGKCNDNSLEEEIEKSTLKKTPTKKVAKKTVKK